MSGASQSEAKEGKSSRRPSPLRATVPLQAMHRTSPLRLRNRISPDTELMPWDHMPTTPTKGRCGSSRGSNNDNGGGPTMRRTASLDAIYLKGQWPKDTHPFSDLTVDKYSQTPEEWASTCYGSLSMGFSACEEMGSCGRRPSTSPAVCLPLPQAAAPQPQHFDKFIRQRLQRTNKESGGSAVRYSPIHGDHSVLAPTPIHPRHQALQTSNGNSRAVPIPQSGRSMLPRLRNSVEGLNQEIERLVLRTSHLPGDDLDQDDVWSEVCRDGRRAPIADFMRFTRSVDTQTPARTTSTTSQPSSLHTSPSISPPMSPQQRSASASGISPSPPHTPKLATSPHINKFNREPPDGCERVALKLSEDSMRSMCASGEEDWLTVKPCAAFTLRPSQGSAFSTLERHSVAGELSSSLPSGRMYYSSEEAAEYSGEYSGGEEYSGGIATAECSTSTSSLAQPCCSSDTQRDQSSEDQETTHDQ